MTNVAFYGLTAVEVEDVGRALWQAWRRVGPRTMRAYGGGLIPAVDAIAAAIPEVERAYLGPETALKRATVRFVLTHTTWACLDVARGAGYFASATVGL